MYLHTRIEEQATLPTSAIAFREYLHRHHLEPLQVALASGVRYLLVWRLWSGAPIGGQHEQPIRHALFHLTGEPYTVRMLLCENEDMKQRQTTTPGRS